MIIRNWNQNNCPFQPQETHRNLDGCIPEIFWLWTVNWDSYLVGRILQPQVPKHIKHWKHARSSRWMTEHGHFFFFDDALLGQFLLTQVLHLVLASRSNYYSLFFPHYLSRTQITQRSGTNWLISMANLFVSEWAPYTIVCQNWTQIALKVVIFWLSA